MQDTVASHRTTVDLRYVPVFPCPGSPHAEPLSIVMSIRPRKSCQPVNGYRIAKLLTGRLTLARRCLTVVSVVRSGPHGVDQRLLSSPGLPYGPARTVIPLAETVSRGMGTPHPRMNIHMKTTSIWLTPGLVLLAAVLARCDGEVFGQDVQPGPRAKVDTKLLDTYVGQYHLQSVP